MSIHYAQDIGPAFNVVSRDDAAAAGDVVVDLRITRPAGATKKDVVQLIDNMRADYIKQDDVADETPAATGTTALIEDGDTWVDAGLGGGTISVAIVAGVPTFTYTAP